MIENSSDKDLPDMDCNIMLISAARKSNSTGGYITSENNEWIWFGELKASNESVESGWIPKVLYLKPASHQWVELETVLDRTDNNYSYFVFKMYEGLIGPSMSGTSITNTVINLIPYLSKDQYRVFDHNRIAGIFDSYSLTIDNSFMVEQDSGLCSLEEVLSQKPVVQPVSAIVFSGDNTVTLEQTPVENGKIRIDYDLQRLSNCRGTHNGYPAWDISVFVKFHPSEQLYQSSVRSFITENGYPTNTAEKVIPEFTVPSGTEEIEIWFSNSEYGGSTCIQWDSVNGANYHFEVLMQPSWIGNGSVKISRDDSTPCDYAIEYSEPVTWDSWERTRTVAGNFCFEAWQPGVTDFQNDEIWKIYDARVYYRFPGLDFSSEYVNFIDFNGNNARYSFNLSRMDPFMMYTCPPVEPEIITTASGETRAFLPMEFYFSINGKIMENTNDLNGVYIVNYEDYSPNQFREEFCE